MIYKKSNILKIIFLLFIIQLKLTAQTCPQVSTYFGKLLYDDFKGICEDTKGNIYAIGNTYNANLPVTVGAFQPTYKADYEAFIVKFDSCGALIWCTYFGSLGFDSAEKIAYSNDSTFVITGYTNGNDLDTTFNCFQAQNNGNYDCYLAKFNLNGQAKWVSYFGSTNVDLAYDITIDNSLNIIIGGTTLSPTLYTTPQSFQPNLTGATDAFVAKFNKNGALKFCTYYGGNSAEDIHAITTDTDKNIIAVGGSFSNNLNTSSGCLQASANGSGDIYVIKLDSIGNRIFSTYIGGSSIDDAYGVCADNLKNIYLTGHTSSINFYTTSVSYQPNVNGLSDNYCLKLSPTGSLIWSTIFGGTSYDYNARCKITSANQIISLINTQSADFPMLGTSNYTVHHGANDMAIVVISNNGQLIYSTLSGGSGNENGADFFINNNELIIDGASSSADFNVINGNYQLINNGQDDGVISTIVLPFTTNSILKNNAYKYCNPIITNKFLLEVPCSVKKIIIYDALGNQVQAINNDENNTTFSLTHLNAYQLYFIIGFNNFNDILFTQKIFKY
jgi:hypothetical protein